MQKFGGTCLVSIFIGYITDLLYVRLFSTAFYKFSMNNSFCFTDAKVVLLLIESISDTELQVNISMRNIYNQKQFNKNFG